MTDPGTLDTFTAVAGTYATAEGGTVTIATDGAATYTPPAGFPFGVPSATDSFTYTVVDDDTGSDMATVTITVKNLVDLSGRVFDDLNNNGLFDAGYDLALEGVEVQVWDDAMTTMFGSGTTDSYGRYFLDANLAAGTYRLVEVYDDNPDSPTFKGLLDGLEKAGNLGGTVVNGEDSNVIGGIAVGQPGTTADAVDYLFAEVKPSELFGRVWRDFNNDGQYNFGEADIDGVPITLTGTDDRGTSVSLSTTTSGDMGYAFINLRPGEYAIEETQPVNFDDGLESLGEVSNPYPVNQPPAIDGGLVESNDRFSGIKLAPGSLGDYYNFGELPQPGDQMPDGSTASIGFWHNKNGQALIERLSDFAAANDGSPTQLGDWLAATLPSMYGSGALYGASTGADRDMNLAGRSDAYIAETFAYLHQRNKKTMIENGGVPKVDAQVLAVALAMYATSENLAGTVARDYGFTTSADGIAYSTFNVLDVLTVEEAEMLGLSVANGNLDASGNATIIDILWATDAKATIGLLYDHDQNLSDGDDGGDGTIDAFERLLRILANDLYTAINE